MLGSGLETEAITSSRRKVFRRRILDVAEALAWETSDKPRNSSKPELVRKSDVREEAALMYSAKTVSLSRERPMRL